ncbi:unnamed protein product [Paramecium pentaurelia]|uniref:Uncharacterized protein n=1 Tax=Paramecium pentaurelia TaxID=43138 RepID=A0A8S1RW72_9CILI|nr:unnamed protein product [Paramecium pentaurelia]
MYKLNILAPKQFFDLQTPINFLVKKKNFANVREIRQTNKNEQGNKINSYSLPHNIWIYTPLNQSNNRIIKPQGSLALHQKINKLPIYMSRKDMINELEKFKQRACSTSPSKKQKKYHNLFYNNVERNEKLKKYFQTYSSNSPQKLNSISNIEDSRQQFFTTPKSYEINYKRLNSVNPSIQTKFPQLKKNQIKAESKEIDRQNSELMNTSINQNCQDKFSPIQESSQPKKYYQINKCSIQRNKFLNDSYRLYGFVTEIKEQKQKYSALHVSNFNNLNKSTEQNINASQSKSREVTPQNKSMKKSKSSKDKLCILLKQSHLKYLERHLKTSDKRHKSPKKLEEYEITKDKNIILSYFPNQQSSQILKKNNNNVFDKIF